MDEDNKQKEKIREVLEKHGYRLAVFDDGQIGFSKGTGDEPISRKEYVEILWLMKRESIETDFIPQDSSYLIVELMDGTPLNYEGDILVFSNIGTLERFMSALSDGILTQIKSMEWRNLVDKYEKDFEIALLDYAGIPGAYKHLPLLKMPTKSGKA